VCKTKKGVNQCKVKCTDDELYQNESIVLWSENDAGKWSTYTVDKLKATCRCPKIAGSNEKECAWYIGAGETYNLDQVYCTRTASTEAPSNSTTMHSTRAPTTAAQTEWEDVVDTIQPGLKCGSVPPADESKIVGGVITEEHDYPWQVRLTIDGDLLCGGTILSDRWVLTAAHCCEEASSILITIGDYDRSTEDAGEFTVAARDIIMHPEYQQHPQSNHANDICLLRTPNLKAKKNADTVYAAACLPTADYQHGEACHVSGWGGWGKALRAVGVNLMSIEFCNDPKNVDAIMVNKTIDKLEMCAGTPDSTDDDNTLVDAGKGACQRDSGGPLTCVRNGQPVVAGIYSWGKDCFDEGKPGVYVNTFSYTDWILYQAEVNGFPLTT